MTLRPELGALVEIEEKAVTDSGDVWTVTGYASVFNNTDLGNDVVLPGAFAKSLRDHGLPLFLFNHKMEDAPIGTVIDAKEDRKGLWYKSELPKDDSFVNGRIIPQLKKRGIRGNSIGYKATQKAVRKDGVRELKEIRLYEISVVNMPMNPLASVDTVKGFVAFQDLPLDDPRCKTWDPQAAMKRLKSRFNGDVEEYKRAFIYVDPDRPASEWDVRFLIGDVDDKGRLIANHNAVFKAAAVVYGSRSEAMLPEGADDAVQAHLDRYYQRMDLESPAKSLSVKEYEVLTLGEREARLRGLGISQRLAKQLLGGQRDADRKEAPKSSAVHEAVKGLLDAIKQTTQDLKIS